jgi:anti-anti-sigma factor
VAVSGPSIDDNAGAGEDQTSRVQPFTIDLPADAATPRMARTEVAERVGDIPRRDELLLCISEVVTNAVLHAGTPKHLSVREEAGHLLVEVADGDPRVPVKRAHDLTSPTGRGLHFLDDLATRWGSRPTDDGKVVWFEFALTPGAPAAEPGAQGEDRDGGAVTIVAEREVDLLSAVVLRDRLENAIEEGARHLVVDLAGCDFLDSTGLSVLATSHLRLRRLGGRLEAIGAHGAVASVLRLSGVGELLGGDAPA